MKATNQCKTCATPIGWIDCPTGGWWAHHAHPADDHDAVPGFAQPVFTCPSCDRSAPWTDGRSKEAGDEVDEFWCQTCGTESPLESCDLVDGAR